MSGNARLPQPPNDMPAPTTKTERGTKVLAVWLPVITVIIGLAYAAIGYYILLLPKISQLLPGGEYDLTGIQARISEDEKFMTDANAAMAKFSGLSLENRKRASQIVPLGDADIAGILVQLDEIARANNMRLKNIDAVISEKIVTALGRKPVRISATFEGGNYEQYKLLLKDIERSLRLFDVQNLTIARGASTYSMVLTSYFLDKPSAAAAKPAAK